MEFIQEFLIKPELCHKQARIAGEYVEKMFDPFCTTKEPNENMITGLSLHYISILEHDGQIKLLNNTVRVGFIIELSVGKT